MKPRVSIISINYKQAEASHQFLDTCLRLTYPEVEIILVDNAPDPRFIEQTQDMYPTVKLIPSELNLGFAGGNNLGIKEATGDFLLFVNNDTLLPQDLIAKLLAGFESDPLVGVVCPKIQYIDPPNLIQFAGYTPIHPLTGRNKTLGLGEVDEGQFDTTSLSPYAHGAAMMVKKEVIQQVGPMPEEFFLYYEELDWSVNIRKAGFKILYYPKAMIRHHASLSTGPNSPLKTYYYYRNRILFMKRNTPTLPLLIFYLYFFVILSPLTFLNFLLRGKWKHSKAFLQAISWHFGLRKSSLFE